MGYNFYVYNIFGWKAIIITFINTILIIVLFYKELSNINIRTTVSDREKDTFCYNSSSFYISFLVVYFGHYPAFFMSIFLLFLGVTYAYQQYQDRLMLREGLLVCILLGWFGNIRWSARVVAKRYYLKFE